MKRKTKKCPKCEEVMLSTYSTCRTCGACDKKAEVIFIDPKKQDKKEISATCPSCEFKFLVSA